MSGLENKAMTIGPLQLQSGAAAHALLGNAEFREAWAALCARCPHATGFQTPAFVCTWFASYGEAWQPVIVSAASAATDGELDGLWLLAYHAASGVLAHAGTHQAEYHVWLATPGADAAFLAAAWPALLQHFSFANLRFKYLPNAALAETLLTVGAMRDCVAVQLHQRPLARLDAADIKASFAKKSNKSRVNRLKKAGALAFHRITDPAELEQAFDAIIACYDLRQGGVNHLTPFHDDPLKRGFYSALFAASDDAVVTMTTLDDQPIAAFWGTVSGATVHLGILAHSPVYAEHSPGKLHIMQLSEHLLQNGKQVLDLTPGGDPWKERFANAHDTVAEVTLYTSAAARQKADRRESLLQAAKQAAFFVGLTPSRVRAARTFLQKAVRGGWRQSGSTIGSTTTDDASRVYRGDRLMASGFSPDGRVARNALADLLCFQAVDGLPGRDAFFSEALARLENGWSVFTVCIAGRLAHHGWMAPKAFNAYLSEAVPEAGSENATPVASVRLQDFFTHPDFRRRGLYRVTVETMMCQAFADPTLQYCFISRPINNMDALRAIERLGWDDISLH